MTYRLPFARANVHLNGEREGAAAGASEKG
jgi:hypothetical protein